MREFPPFRLDTVNQCLWRTLGCAPQERILLAPKAFAVLRYLVEHPGRLRPDGERETMQHHNAIERSRARRFSGSRVLWPPTILFAPRSCPRHLFAQSSIHDRDLF